MNKTEKALSKAISKSFQEYLSLVHSRRIKLALKAKGDRKRLEAHSLGKTCYIYCRTATQTSSQAIIYQQKNCQEFAKENNIDIRGSFLDLGESGNTLDRPGLKALLKEIDLQPVDVVIVTRNDRLSRNHLLEESIKKRLKGAGVKVFSTYPYEN